MSVPKSVTEEVKQRMDEYLEDIGNGVNPPRHAAKSGQKLVIYADVTESRAMVKETIYDRGMDIAYLVGLLRNQRVTGTLRIDLSQGGVCSIRLEERQKISGGNT